MKLISKFWILTLLAMLPWIASAQGPGWVYNLKVVRIVTVSTGGINVRFSPDLSGCTSQSGYGAIFGSIYPNHVGINRMKADLLYAYATGDFVSVYLGDNTCMITEMFLGQG